MKLIVCLKCNDVVSLRYEDRTCFCSCSGGRYTGKGAEAEIWGNSIPLGFTNSSFIRALREQPAKGLGSEFTAFVIPKQCDTVEFIEIEDRPEV